MALSSSGFGRAGARFRQPPTVAMLSCKYKLNLGSALAGTAWTIRFRLCLTYVDQAVIMTNQPLRLCRKVVVQL